MLIIMYLLIDNGLSLLAMSFRFSYKNILKPAKNSRINAAFFVLPNTNFASSPRQLLRHLSFELLFHRRNISQVKMPRGKKAKPAAEEAVSVEKVETEKPEVVEPVADSGEGEKPGKKRGKKKTDTPAEDGEPGGKKAKETVKEPDRIKKVEKEEPKPVERVTEAEEAEKPGKKRGKKKAENGVSAEKEEPKPVEPSAEAEAEKPTKKRGKKEDKPAEDVEPAKKEEAKPEEPSSDAKEEAAKKEEAKPEEPSVDTEEEAEKPAKKRGKKKAEDGEPAAKKSKEAKSEEKSKLRKEASLTEGMDFSHDCQTKDGRKPNWKIASWNVNGIRAWMDKGGLSYLKNESPDVLCIQETKCATEDIPDDVKVEGYHDYWSSAEEAGYAGTAIYSKTEPLDVTYGLGIDKHDEEGRVITAEFDKFYLVTAYVPNAGRGLPRLPYRSKEWDVDFRNYINELNKKKPVIMCGDLNVAHEEIDLANPKTNKKTAGFTVEERQGFTNLLAEGYVDSFRVLYPEKVGAYTFWTYMGNARGKNVGWRLDYFVLSERLRDDLCDHVIRKDVMGSDHCPIVLYMAIK